MYAHQQYAPAPMPYGNQGCSFGKTMSIVLATVIICLIVIAGGIYAKPDWLRKLRLITGQSSKTIKLGDPEAQKLYDELRSNLDKALSRGQEYVCNNVIINGIDKFITHLESKDLRAISCSDLKEEFDKAVGELYHNQSFDNEEGRFTIQTIKSYLDFVYYMNNGWCNDGVVDPKLIIKTLEYIKKIVCTDPRLLKVLIDDISFYMFELSHNSWKI
jgi:hypothetical protein